MKCATQQKLNARLQKSLYTTTLIFPYFCGEILDYEQQNIYNDQA
jgi:hypothetical protein